MTPATFVPLHTKQGRYRIPAVKSASEEHCGDAPQTSTHLRSAAPKLGPRYFHSAGAKSAPTSASNIPVTRMKAITGAIHSPKESDSARNRLFVGLTFGSLPAIVTSDGAKYARRPIALIGAFFRHRPWRAVILITPARDSMHQPTHPNSDVIRPNHKGKHTPPKPRTMLFILAIRKGPRPSMHPATRQSR